MTDEHKTIANTDTQPKSRPMISADEVNPISMMFDPVIAERVAAIAGTLAKGRVTVPEHLRGNIGDCLAIVMQAASWRLNPFAVAQKTHLIHGRLGYEAQLINSVVTSIGLLEGRFSYEYLGDWSKIAVRPKIMKGGKGDYATPGWNEKDEQGLGLRVVGKLKGEPEPKEHILWLAMVWPRNSGLWATNPQQQIAYLGVKQWVRKYAPDAILGVYTTDEIQEHVIDAEVIANEPTHASAAIMGAARQVASKHEDIPFAHDENPETETTAPEWPQKGEDGRWRESRGLVFDARVFGMSAGNVPRVNKAGHFCKRRGCDDELYEQVEREQLSAIARAHDESANQDDQPPPGETQPADMTDRGEVESPGDSFGFPEINTAIARAASLDDCDTAEDMLNGFDGPDDQSEELRGLLYTCREQLVSLSGEAQ